MKVPWHWIVACIACSACSWSLATRESELNTDHLVDNYWKLHQEDIKNYSVSSERLEAYNMHKALILSALRSVIPLAEQQQASLKTTYQQDPVITKILNRNEEAIADARNFLESSK